MDTTPAEDPDPVASPDSPMERRLSKLRWYLLAAILGAVLGLTLVIVVVGRMRGTEKLPLLTREDFESARTRWQNSPAPDYDIEVSVTGRQAATYHVQVRQGKVIKATHNGRPLTQRRTMGTWSVPGMFGTMSTDLRNVDKVREGKADRSIPQLTLRGKFHPRWGYPQRYHRTEKIKWGSNREVTWTVTTFDTSPE